MKLSNACVVSTRTCKSRIGSDHSGLVDVLSEVTSRFADRLTGVDNRVGKPSAFIKRNSMEGLLDQSKLCLYERAEIVERRLSGADSRLH